MNIIWREPHSGAVIWLFGRDGNEGKTELSRYLIKTMGALRVLGDQKAINLAIANYTFDNKKIS